MVDPISNQVAQQAANQATQQSAVPPTEIDIHDQSRFEVAMNPSGTQADNPQAAADVANGDVTPAEKPTLGDAILNGLEKIKNNHEVRAENIESQLTKSVGKDLSVQDCVKLQFEVMQMGMEQELTGKIADKTSQGVQTLFKNQ